MKLTKKTKIFYPVHGAGWVRGKKIIEIGGQKKEYVEFHFISSNLSVSTPIENLEKLGIREINPTTTITKLIKELKTTMMKCPPTKNYNEFITLIKELVSTGELANFILIIQYSQYIKKKREEDGRLTPVGIVNNMRKSINLIVSELAIASDIDFETAEKKFEKLVGLTIDQLLS